jgi:hypothetical protein
MKKRIIIISIIAISIFLVSLIYLCPRFVFLSPACYCDNDSLTEQENYFIKKNVLEAVENKLSIFGNGNEVNNKHVFIFIDRNFMKHCQKTDDGYIVRVQTYFMISFSDDAVYEIKISDDFSIRSIGIDP